jgi:hypothetical protein
MSAFRREFGLDLSSSNLAELFVALELNLRFPEATNQRGFDLIDQNGARYQVKRRSPSTHNIDINNFTFDYLVVVQLGDDWLPVVMWKAAVSDIQPLCTRRENFRKFQLSQVEFRSVAKELQFTRVLQLIRQSEPEAGTTSQHA